MLKCRVLFIEVLVLAALVLILLFLLFRHHTVTTVISGGNLSGGYAETGDRIAFTTLYQGDEGYQVNFRTPYPCKDSDGNNITSLSVSPGKTTYCTVTASSGQQGSGVVFSYTITQGPGPVVEPSKTHKGSSRDGKHGVSTDGAIPCKNCSPVVGGGDGDGGYELGGDVKVDAMGGDAKVKERATSSNNVTEIITCNGPNDPPAVTSTPVVAGNNAKVNWEAGNSWTAYTFVPVPPSTGTACSNGNSFSQDTLSYCRVQDPGKYTYKVTLNGCLNTPPSTGYLTIQPSPQGQAPK
jgi:hypothetical protein